MNSSQTPNTFQIPPGYQKNLIKNLHEQIDSIHGDLYNLKKGLTQDINLHELARIYELVNSLKKSFDVSKM